MGVHPPTLHGANLAHMAKALYFTAVQIWVPGGKPPKLARLAKDTDVIYTAQLPQYLS